MHKILTDSRRIFIYVRTCINSTLFGHDWLLLVLIVIDLYFLNFCGFIFVAGVHLIEFG